MNKILSVGTGYWASRTLLSAIELDVFTHLGSGARDAASLTEALGLHPRGARDFLDALVALGFLTRDGDRYANTRESRMFLDRTKPLFVGGSFTMAGPRLWDAWGRLTEALRTGKPQYDGAAEGHDVFGGMYADPAMRDQFLESMAGASTGTAMALARSFPWKDYGSFADVGTAQGVVPVQIAKAHPHLRAVGYDLPAVREPFEAYVNKQGLSDRVRFQGGDFFVDPMPEADVLIMGHILHDWDLDEKRTLIARAYDALEPGGALLIYEALIDDERRGNEFGLLMSLNMLVDTPGGFNFTAADCGSWLEDAGFSSWRVQPLVEPDSLIVAVK
jgi:SAM-dependent methyltransferase